MKIALDDEVSYFLRVHDFPCRAWYAGQPPQCSVCRKYGHRASDCPLSGLCRRCHQPRHLARKCWQAWGSVQPDTEVLVGGPLAPDDDSREYVPHSDDGAQSDDREMAFCDEEVDTKAALPQPRPLCSALAVSTSSSSASVSPALVSAVSPPPSSASVPASPDVHSSVPAVRASSAVASDIEPVISVASYSVPASRSLVVAHRNKIDSYLLSPLGDFSRDDVVPMSPARVTDFVSRVIDKNGLSISIWLVLFIKSSVSFVCYYKRARNL